MLMPRDRRNSGPFDDENCSATTNLTVMKRSNYIRYRRHQHQQTDDDNEQAGASEFSVHGVHEEDEESTSKQHRQHLLEYTPAAIFGDPEEPASHAMKPRHIYGSMFEREGYHTLDDIRADLMSKAESASNAFIPHEEAMPVDARSKQLHERLDHSSLHAFIREKPQKSHGHKDYLDDQLDAVFDDSGPRERPENTCCDPKTLLDYAIRVALEAHSSELQPDRKRKRTNYSVMTPEEERVAREQSKRRRATLKCKREKIRRTTLNQLLEEIRLELNIPDNTIDQANILSHALAFIRKQKLYGGVTSASSH